MRRILGVALFALGFQGGGTAAQVTEIFKCMDEKGRPLYTSDRRDTTGKKCELVSREVNVVATPPAAASKPAPPAASKAPSPAGFPREDPAARASAKDRQRQILERELTQEEELLGKAKKELTEQEGIRTGDEKNYARVLERLQKFRDNVVVHEKNVEALKRELLNLNR